MRKIDEQKLALSIAAVVLLRDGEISTDDIRSLPFLSDDFDARLIVDSLLELFDAEVFNRKLSSSPFLRWEQVIRLKAVPHGQQRYASSVQVAV
jgi:hypothetical protein